MAVSFCPSDAVSFDVTSERLTKVTDEPKGCNWRFNLNFGKPNFEFWLGCRHSSVDLSAPSILPPRVRVPNTTLMLLSINIWIVSRRKDENKQKRPGLAHFRNFEFWRVWVDSMLVWNEKERKNFSSLSCEWTFDTRGREAECLWQKVVPASNSYLDGIINKNKKMSNRKRWNLRNFDLSPIR